MCMGSLSSYACGFPIYPVLNVANEYKNTTKTQNETKYATKRYYKTIKYFC